MKKLIRYLLFSFALSCVFMLFGTRLVSASDFWNAVGQEFSLLEAQSDSLVFNPSFNSEGYESYNYSFPYEYKLKTAGAVSDYGSPISVFYASDKAVTVEYTDLKGSLFSPINDYFIAYKYNFQTQEFYDKVCETSKNSEGECTISDEGVYKLVTEGTSGINVVTYLLIEDEFASANFESANYKAQTKQIEASVIVSDPRTLKSCGTIAVTIAANSVSYNDCVVENVENTVSMYRVTLQIDTPSSLDFVKAGRLSLSLLGGRIATTISYDKVASVLTGDVTYLNPGFVSQALTKTEENGMSLAANFAAKFIVEDQSLIKSATLNDQSCNIKPVPGELSKTSIYCQFVADSEVSQLTYLVTDNYGNVYKRVVEDVKIDDSLLNADDNLEYHVTIANEGVGLKVDTDVYSDIKQICIFYGDPTKDVYNCEHVYVLPEYHYKGKITILVSDESLNYDVIEIDNINFEHGYAVENYTSSDIVGDMENEVNFSTHLKRMKRVACKENELCLDSISVFVKYDEFIEEVEDGVESLPTYVEMLNKKFKDTTCATSECNKVVELFITYDVGGVPQSVSQYYEYVDNIPYIQTTIGYKENVSLEYKEFDITSDAIDGPKQLLYGDEFFVQLKDKDNKSYSAKVMPIFVQYTDRLGNVTSLNDLSYDYIAQTSELGNYLLECRIRLLKNLTDEVQYTDAVYAKSFFINVNLQDTELPVLTLTGDSTMAVQQYDVFREPGYSCDDKSGCDVIVKYYLNDKNNSVSEVDTGVAGEYIIEYIGVDADGNQTIVSRVVRVNGVNSLDATSIIVIIVVIVLFAGFITFGVIREVKKNKRITKGE